MEDTRKLPIAQAAYPSPFTPGLEFNPPAHGVWNIVHVGMQVPGAHQIYVCAINCMRGVILTAAEMNASDRFSFVILNEEDLIEGTVEDITIAGVADVIDKLPAHPPAVILFTVCLHRFLGSDLDRIYRELSDRFPDITFIRASMEPITQKAGLIPDMLLRKSIFDPLQPLPEDHTVSILGGDFPLDETSDLKVLLTENGYGIRELRTCHTYEDYLQMGASDLYLSVFPRAAWGSAQTAERLERPQYYLPASFDYEEIQQELSTLSKALAIPPKSWEAEIASCEAALTKAGALIGDTPVFVDATAHPRPLGLARLLLTHGFRVDTVYLDAITSEEEPDFRALQQQFTQLSLSPTNQVECRVVSRKSNCKELAIGQIAAWRRSTPYFVNLVEGGGLWGFDGIRQLLALMEDAFLHEKDTEDLVPRKGLGCESCV